MASLRPQYVFKSRGERRRLAARMAQGLGVAEIAAVERLRPVRVQELIADPSFRRLVEAHGDLAAMGFEARLERLTWEALELLERALAMGDVRAAIFIAREVQAGRNPARTLAEAAERIWARLGLERMAPPEGQDPLDDPLLRHEPGGVILTLRDIDAAETAAKAKAEAKEAAAAARGESVDPDAELDEPRPHPSRRPFGWCAAAMDAPTSDALVAAEVQGEAKIHAGTRRGLARQLEDETLRRLTALPEREAAAAAALPDQAVTAGARRLCRTAQANPWRSEQAAQAFVDHADGKTPRPPRPPRPPDG